MMLHKKIIGNTKYYYVYCKGVEILGLSVKSLFITLDAFLTIEKRKK